jgi:transcription initiation factor TFIID TATA-box-binding protein
MFQERYTYIPFGYGDTQGIDLADNQSTETMLLQKPITNGDEQASLLPHREWHFKTQMNISIENVVASAALEQNIDLDSIAGTFPMVEYHPQTFPGLIYRAKKPRATALIFRSGRMVCTGAKSERQAKKAVTTILDDLKRSGIVIVVKPDIKIQNIVATAEIADSADLEKAAYELERTIYDPEQFPGLIHRMDDPKVVILIFASGKIVCAGAKKQEEVYQAIARIQKTLKEKNLINN